MAKRKEGKNGKPKRKSVKADVNSRMNAKRKLSRLGKKVKKGKAGPSTEFITRSAAMRKLQITLKDFRRLCILKGIYPRVPNKPLKGADKIYYDIKDISYISNEPLLEKFREFKAFMKKIRRAAGRNQFTEARRVNDLKPRMVLDHLVKERYPRFIDAVRDLDDCLCMIHLFAALPSVGRITAERTSACAKLAREWQYFVSKSKSLRKVFVSVKGIYYQAEVMGETVNWLVPHAFTQHLPPAVDFRVMVTFMEFYEIFFKFVLHKLYSKEGWQYPPVVDERLDHAGCCLLAMKTEGDSRNASTTVKAIADSSNTDGQSSGANAQTTVVEGAEFQGKVKSLTAFLQKQKEGDEEEDDDDEEEDELDISAPLSAAFSDLQRESTGFDDDETDVFLRNNEAAAARQQLNIFSKLTFFVNREVPLPVMQLCITAFGGRISWEGPGAPYRSDDPSITHHIVDRPVQNQATLPGSLPREYIQPQWIFDSINAGLLLPARLYAPAAKLPPHLSPFVDDEKEGYLPRYREEIQKLQVEAGIVDEVAVSGNTAKATKGKNEVKSKASNQKSGDATNKQAQKANGKAAAAAKKSIDMDEDESEEESEEEEDSEDDEEDNSSSNDSDEAPEELMEVSAHKKKQTNNQKAEVQSKKGPKAIVQKAKTTKQSETEEMHELAVSMMSKKTKKLYDKMQFGINQKQESVQRLENKRRDKEAEDSASNNQRQSKKQRRA